MFNFLKKRESAAINETKSEKTESAFSQKIDKISDFFSEKFDFAKEEFFVIKEKFKNLRETNYNLGLSLLESGRISEAIFRFRFTKTFWPDLIDAHYQLAYCLALNGRFFEAKKTLQKLLLTHPSCEKKVFDLLKEVESKIAAKTDE